MMQSKILTSQVYEKAKRDFQMCHSFSTRSSALSARRDEMKWKSLTLALIIIFAEGKDKK